MAVVCGGDEDNLERHFDLSQLFFHWSRDARRCVIYLHGPVAFLFSLAVGPFEFMTDQTREIFFLFGVGKGKEISANS